jgi:hypothetical protein
MRFAGNFLGKPVFVKPDAPASTVDDLRQHLSRFNLAWVLRMVGGAGADLRPDAHRDLGGVVASQQALRYIALAAVEASSDANQAVPQRDDILQAVRIFDGLPDIAPATETDGVLEHLVRVAYAQFAGRDDLHNMIARTWTIYERIWPTVPKASSFDVRAAIRAEAGLSTAQMMFFGLAYLSNVAKRRDGFFRPYSYEGLLNLPSSLAVGPSEHRKFIELVSASYDDIRMMARSLPRPPGLDQYTLSPFLVKPVLRPDAAPPGADGVYLVPVPQFLAMRVTQGVYHMLATSSNAGGGANAFKVAFGHVFEAYVVELLRQGCGTCEVVGEFEYGPRSSRKLSPDCLVLDGKRLVAVEVKQSALPLSTKSVGDLAAMAGDLKKTLTKAARQLLTFESDVMQRASGLENFACVSAVELLVVTHDDLAWPNWLLREQVVKDVPGAERGHFCTVGDLENLQRYCWGQSPFELLASKRRGPASHFDFLEWLAGLGSPDRAHPMLERIFKELTASWGLQGFEAP